MVVISTDAVGKILHAVHGGQGVVKSPHHEAEAPQVFLGSQIWDKPTDRLAESDQRRLEFLGVQVLHDGQWIGQAAAQ